HAQSLGQLIRRLSVEVNRALIRHREAILERQYVQERIARAAMELFASACVLSRWDAEIEVAPPRQNRMAPQIMPPNCFSVGPAAARAVPWRKCGKTTMPRLQPRRIWSWARRLSAKPRARGHEGHRVSRQSGQIRSRAKPS